jgi:hypothetical protein
MKNSKGFAPVLILVAVLAVLAIGGGAYYFGTTNNPVPENTQEDNYQSQENQNNIVNTSVVNSNSTSDLALRYITSTQVGLFQVMEPVPDPTLLAQAKYSIEETTIFPEGMPQKQFIVYKGGKNLLTLNMFPDLSKIYEISVFSPEFKTKEGIGFDSTVSDFIKVYPNYKFWYSHEEGEHFVLNTSSSKASPQFLLDRSGLLYPNKSFSSTPATISDFKTSAKIVRVRVY